MKCDAVFEGGGVKGIAFAGAIQEVEDRGYTFNNVAGTSAGALTASLVAAGYTGKEIAEQMRELSFLSFLDSNLIGRVPWLGKVINILIQNGMYKGMNLELWIKDKLEQKGIRTFADLRKGQLKLIASDITNAKVVVLPDDLPVYGEDPEKFSVAEAVRMSCSIPYFFSPRKLMHGETKCYIVDGGLISNFPLWLFDVDSIPRWPTFGFRLRACEPQPEKIRGPITMFAAMFSTMMEAHDRRYIENHDAVRTIFIPVEDIRATHFSINDDEKERLIQYGKQEAEQFFKKWDFTTYIHKYRRIPITIETKRSDHYSL